MEYLFGISKNRNKIANEINIESFCNGYDYPLSDPAPTPALIRATAIMFGGFDTGLSQNDIFQDVFGGRQGQDRYFLFVRYFIQF